jgi:hypothetical protein
MFGLSPGLVIPVVAIIAWAVIKIVRIKHGAEHGWHDNPRNTHVPPMFEKMFEKAMQDRDAEIARLRERIEVLEKIVTDTHAKSSLASEIDRLRDTK